MIVDVVQLRRKGIRLRPAGAVASDARRADAWLTTTGSTCRSSARRASRICTRSRSPGLPPLNLLTPIFDAEVILVDGDTLTIIGTELDTGMDNTLGQSRVTEYGQVWRCTLVRA